ncbi:hypothetical protein CEXT_649011 [Caerostris extrusa]|uniref:Uncharacterized protein n=1 Tax=Caerostris extrusa TaxID=172846 RepID=A0AAV4XMB7_CAEEX|nr:hypothetical protein CEXT_649011 [Caerostris extrusa]
MSVKGEGLFLFQLIRGKKVVVCLASDVLVVAIAPYFMCCEEQAAEGQIPVDIHRRINNLNGENHACRRPSQWLREFGNQSCWKSDVYLVL